MRMVATISLSATGSRNAPNGVLQFHFRARYPSKKSVIDAPTNRAKHHIHWLENHAATSRGMATTRRRVRTVGIVQIVLGELSVFELEAEATKFASRRCALRMKRGTAGALGRSSRADETRAAAAPLEPHDALICATDLAYFAFNVHRVGIGAGKAEDGALARTVCTWETGILRIRGFARSQRLL